jgi:hypothetical protein
VTVQPTITQWSSGVEKSVSAAWKPEIISDKSKVLKYALALSDGKFVNLLNADEFNIIMYASSTAVAALIKDRIATLFNSTSYKDANVSGVVYFLNGAGYYLSTDKKLSSSYRNGLIIGRTKTATNWQDKSRNYKDGNEMLGINYLYLQSHSDYYSMIALEGYNKNNSSAGYNSIADKTTIHGYSDTQLMKVYNETIPYGRYIYEVSGSNVTYRERTVNIVNKLSTTAIPYTSGWYVPSYKEVELLFDEYYSYASISNFILKNILDNLSLSFYNSSYWTSTEGEIDESESYLYIRDANSGTSAFQYLNADFCCHAYFFQCKSDDYTPILFDKFETTYYDRRPIYTLNVCAF